MVAGIQMVTTLFLEQSIYPKSVKNDKPTGNEMREKQNALRHSFGQNWAIFFFKKDSAQ